LLRHRTGQTRGGAREAVLHLDLGEVVIGDSHEYGGAVGPFNNERIDDLVAQTGITYPWVQDPSGNFFYEASATGMPTTLLLDRRGRILANRTGAFDDLAELQAWIDRYRPPT